MNRSICYSDTEIKLRQAEYENVNPIGVGEDYQNPFKRLPDDLIVSHIFNKISEAKSLCSSSLVSKHFSSLVFRSHTVSFKIPVPIPYQEHPQSRPLSSTIRVPRVISSALRFLHDILQTVVGKSPAAVDTQFVVQLSANFLAKFKSLKSLYLELDYSGDTVGRESLIKWQGDSKSDSFVLLMAESDDDPVADEAGDGDIIPLAVCVEYCLTDALIRSSFLEMLVPLLSTELEHVVVMDAKKQGTLSLGEDELIHLRKPRTVDYRTVSAKVWSAPVLKLPLSGCIMKTARLFMFKGSDEFDDYSIVEEAFKGHKMYREAATELLKKEAVYDGILETKEI